MRKNPFSHIRLVYRRSSILVKSVVLATLVVSILALVILRTSIQAQKAQQAELEYKAALLEQENRALAKRIAELGTVESVKRIATLQLGLVDPDTVIFVTPDN